MRWVLRALGALCAVVVVASAASAAELLMYRRAGCPWCAMWDREIGPIYPKTDIGRRIPLRMVDLDRGDAPAVRVRSPVRYTPTFVLVENGKEVGRIEGYPGDAFFWGLLEQMVEQLPHEGPKGGLVPASITVKPERTP
jgi:hypothetical protein